MAQSQFIHAKISGISAVLPATEIRLEDELQYFGGDIKKAQRMTKMVGIDRRRRAAPGVTAADLCQQAAERLFAGMGVDKARIDALIFISQQPDHPFPATACIVQHKLGLAKTCAAFDVNQGCSAYTYGLWLASSLLESRAATRVLLLVGETPGKMAPAGNRIVDPIFGDAGTATLLEYSEEPRPSWFALGTDGGGYETIIVPAGGARLPLPQDAAGCAALAAPLTDKNGAPWSLLRTYMDGGAIFDFTLNVVPGHIRELLDYAGFTPEDMDLLVLHQANKQIVRAVAEKAGFPLEKAPWESFGKYGNLAGASIPGALCDLPQGALDGAKRLLLSGFGVGLSWASAVLTLNGVWRSLSTYKSAPGHPTPDQVRDCWIRKLTGEPAGTDTENNA